jgi:uncharacterized protein YkwD
MTARVQHRPRRVLARTIAVAATSLALAGLLAWSPTPTTGWNQGQAEATLWQLLNGARANNGRAPLQQHSTLVGLARWRSKDMIERNYFSHTIAGCGCQVYRYYDSNGLSYVWGGENIGWNNGLSDAQSPISIHEGFMNSAGHRSNVLESSWTHGGVGAWAANNISFLGKLRSPRMYTQLFMQARSAAAPAPTPAPAPKPPPSAPAPTPPPSGSAPAPALGGSAPAPAPGGSAAAAPMAAAPTPTPEPQPKSMRVETARQPQPSREVGTPTILVPPTPVVAQTAAVPDPADPKEREHVERTVVQTSLRVEAPAQPERGFLETIISSLLAFLLG